MQRVEPALVLDGGGGVEQRLAPCRAVERRPVSRFRGPAARAIASSKSASPRWPIV